MPYRKPVPIAPGEPNADVLALNESLRGMQDDTSEAVGVMPDALKRAYQYLAEKQRMLTSPFRAGAGILKTGVAKGGDAVMNALASVAGARRPDPGYWTGGALDRLDVPMREFQGGAQSVADAMRNARMGTIGALGWEPDEEPAAAQPTPGLPPAQGALPRAPTPSGGGLDTTRMPLVPGMSRGAPEPAGDVFAGRGPEERAALERVIAASRRGEPANVSVEGQNALNRGALPAPEYAGMPSGAHDFYTPYESVGPNAETVAATPRRPDTSLADEMRKRMAPFNQRQPSGVTEEQKKRAILEASLAILAASRPGATSLQAIGEGGQRGTALVRDFERTNREEAERRRREGRDDERLLLDFIGRDRDYQARREDRKEDVTDRRADRAERRDFNKQRLDLLKQQLEQGKWKAVNNAKTGTLVLYDMASGQTRDTGIKFDASDKRPAEVQVLEYLQKNPKALEMAMSLKRKETGQITPRDVFSKYVDTVRGNPKMINRDPREVVDEAMRFVLERNRGAGPARKSGEISRSDPRYQEALRDPRVGGDKKKLDELLQKRGLKVMD